MRGGASFPWDQALSEFGEAAVGHHRQSSVDQLQDRDIRLTERNTRFVRDSRVKVLPLTLMSPVSFSLYWTPVTQLSSSCRLITVPSMNVTLGGAGQRLATYKMQL